MVDDTEGVAEARTLSDDDGTAPVSSLVGYELGALIGKGGMGEVVSARDRRIGRDVAIKRMRAATPDKEQLARFLREAKIQARLDHPAIVPVHELGTDENGHPFFTMKRVSGRTLGQRIADGASQQLLVRAVIDVCRAIDLAHSRGVVHRDLKPANIMLGDFGEVYVLDWGVARVLGDAELGGSRDDIDTLDDGTQTGALLGTPGFMAPEQIKGVPVEQPADVYALGAILFEILAGESLHPRGAAALSTTISAPQDAPARRRSDRQIPPELDAACFSALAESPFDRPTARVLADRLQAYLDGDRDVELRKKLAAEQLALAFKALAAEDRATAIRRAGRALALDPESTDAASLVTQLTVEPPEVLPPELVEHLAVQERNVTSARSRAGLYALLSLFGFWAVFPFLGIKNWPWLVATFLVLLANIVVVWMSVRNGKFNVYLGLVLTLAFAICLTRIAGPFILGPVVMCGVLLAYTASTILARNRWIIWLWTTACFLVPIALEWLGILPRSWEVTWDAMTMHSTIFEMEGWIADWSLIFVNAMFVTTVGLTGVRVHTAHRTAKRTLAIQNWHMNHLLPSQRQPWVARPR